MWFTELAAEQGRADKFRKLIAICLKQKATDRQFHVAPAM